LGSRDERFGLLSALVELREFPVGLRETF